MLQVQLEDLVKALAGNSSDPDFVKALELAKKNNVNSSQDFIGLFESAWAETANGRRLAEIFGTYELRDKIKPESSDKEVIEVVRGEAKSAIDNSFNVLRNRIDRFGVTQPNIQRIENSGASASPSRTSSASRTAARSSSNSRASRTLSVSASSSRVPPPSSSGLPSRPMR